MRKLHSSSKITDPNQVKEYDTVVFEGPPMTEQVLWAEHCVQGTWGAELHKDLKVLLNNILYIISHLDILLFLSKHKRKLKSS